MPRCWSEALSIPVGVPTQFAWPEILLPEKKCKTTRKRAISIYQSIRRTFHVFDFGF